MQTFPKGSSQKSHLKKNRKKAGKSPTTTTHNKPLDYGLRRTLVYKNKGFSSEMSVQRVASSKFTNTK